MHISDLFYMGALTLREAQQLLFKQGNTEDPLLEGAHSVVTFTKQDYLKVDRNSVFSVAYYPA